MITRQTFAPLEGVLRLAFFDKDGARFFDSTRLQALQSFIIPLLMLPMILLPDLPRLQHASLLQGVIVMTLIYAINISGNYVVSDAVLRYLGQPRALLRFITASNWAMVVQTILMFPISYLVAKTEGGSVIYAPILFVIACGLLYYQFLIAKTTLQLETRHAILIILIDGILGFLGNLEIVRLFPLPALS